RRSRRRRSGRPGPRCGSPDRDCPRPSRPGASGEVDRSPLRGEGEPPAHGLAEAPTGELDPPQQRGQAAPEAPWRRRRLEPDRQPTGAHGEGDLFPGHDLDVDRAEALRVPEKDEGRRTRGGVQVPADLALKGLLGTEGVGLEVDPDHAGVASTRSGKTARRSTQRGASPWTSMVQAISLWAELKLCIVPAGTWSRAIPDGRGPSADRSTRVARWNTRDRRSESVPTAWTQISFPSSQIAIAAI